MADSSPTATRFREDPDEQIVVVICRRCIRRQPVRVYEGELDHRCECGSTEFTRALPIRWGSR